MPSPTQLTNFSTAYILTPAGVTAGQLDKAFQVADVSNGNYFVSSGKDLLIVWNTDSSPHTFGIQSAPDQFGRFANITYTVAPNSFEAVIISSQAIYTQANGQVVLSASDAHIFFLPILGA